LLFLDLYAKRWGVETAFDELKNQLKLGVFSGYRTNIVLQDMWSGSMFLQAAQEELDRTKRDCQINRNIAITIMQKEWFNLLLKSHQNSHLSQVVGLMKRYYERRRIRNENKRSAYDRKKLQTCLLTTGL